MMVYSAHEESKMRNAIYAASGDVAALEQVRKQGGFSIPLKVERDRNIVARIEKSLNCKIEPRRLEEHFNGGSNTKSWVRFDIV